MHSLVSARLSALLSIAALSTAPASAQAGTLDTSFGDAGKVMTPFFSPTSDVARCVVAVGSGGRLVAAGSRSGSDFALVAHRADGSLDPSFGSGGKVTTNFGSTDSANALALQPDGRMVVGGSSTDSSGFNDFALASYVANGSLDPSFGVGGMVRTSLGTSHDVCQGLAIQPDGKIIAAGYSLQGTRGYDFALVRYNQDGSLDPTFGSGGIVLTHLGSHDHAMAVALQTDGRIVVAGDSYAGSTLGYVFAVCRYEPDGSLDTMFGSGGGVLVNFGSRDDVAYGVAVQPDGKIVLAGGTSLSSTRAAFALARFEATGALDASFGGGQVGATFGALDVARDIVVDGDGRITVAGYSRVNEFQSSFALMRFATNGTLDAAFGSGGGVRTAVANTYSQADGLAVQGDGKLVAAGLAGYASYDFAVARYLTDGALDTGFGNNGTRTTDIGVIVNALAQDLIAVQSDSKVIVAGSRRSNLTYYDFALARHNCDGSLDASFGSGGKVTTDFRFSITANEYLAAVALQPDGKIVAAGTAGHSYSLSDIVIARYNPDGSLDPTLRGSGMAFSWSGSDQCQALALQGDGRIVVGGYTWSRGIKSLLLVCFRTDGTLDDGFGLHGRVVTHFDGSATLEDLAIQADGRIVVLGTLETDSDDDFLVARYLPNGALDSGFGNGGSLLIDMGATYELARSLAIQPDQKIVIAGSSDGMALARLDSNGVLDPTFGTGGKVRPTFGAAGYPGASSVAIQGDGRIVVAGTLGYGSELRFASDFAVARFHADGSPDTSFGTGGLVTTDFGQRDERGEALTLHANRIVVAGTAVDPYSYIGQFALARYHATDVRIDTLEEMLASIEALATAKTLNHGQARSLQAKLEAALQQIDRGKPEVALHQLGAFVHELDALVRARNLTLAQAQGLYDQAAYLVSRLA